MNHWRKGLWASIAAGWMLIAVSFTFNYYHYAHHYVEIFSTPPTFLQMLVWEIPYWILWAAMAPVVFALAERFPVRRESWNRNAVVHIAACFCLTIAHRVVYLAACRLLYVDAYRNIPTLIDLYRSDLFFNLPTGFMSYATFLLVGNVMEFYSKSAKAELQALKAQLQPHFIFNTLNSISALQMTDVEAANRMTARLGEFLRFTLDSSGTNEIPLRREVELLQSYLEIEQVRFQDRLNVEMDIAAEALDLAVPSLILQPIVENAIRHGIASKTTPGQIQIQAVRSNGTLRLEVRNDGQLLHGANTVPRKDRVGIANTKARLIQLYGNGHRFDMMNASEGGVLVRIEIPAHK